MLVMQGVIFLLGCCSGHPFCRLVLFLFCFCVFFSFYDISVSGWEQVGHNFCWKCFCFLFCFVLVCLLVCLFVCLIVCLFFAVCGKVK